MGFEEAKFVSLNHMFSVQVDNYSQFAEEAEHCSACIWPCCRPTVPTIETTVYRTVQLLCPESSLQMTISTASRRSSIQASSTFLFRCFTCDADLDVELRHCQLQVQV